MWSEVGCCIKLTLATEFQIMAKEKRTALDSTIASNAADFFCELCKLEFSSKEELQEHTWTMLHHGKLNKAKGRDCVHECTLCEETFVELLSFTKHLHADTHQERYHTWKKQQRSIDWEALNQMRLPCPAEVSGRTSYRDRPNTRHKRKNSNGKDVSFRTRQHSQRGGHNYRKNRGNRKLRHFQKDANSFQFNAPGGPEMGHERDFEIMNDSMRSEDRFGRNVGSGLFRSGSPFFGDEQYSNFHPQDNNTSLPGQTNQSDSSWCSRLRQTRHRFSQNVSEPKPHDESFPKGSLRRNNRFSGSPDSSILFSSVGEKESNGNSRPKSASPAMGVPSRTFLSDNMTSRSGRAHNQQINNSDIYSGFVPEKRRNSFGNRENRTRYFKNRTWVSDDLKSRVEESQKGSAYTERKFVSSDTLSLENRDVTRDSENRSGVTRRSGAYQRHSDARGSFGLTFKDNQPRRKSFDSRDSGMNTQEEPRDVGRNFGHSIDVKNAEQRAYFTFDIPDPATGSPEESKAEVIEGEQLLPSGVGSGENEPSTRTRRMRDSNNKRDEKLGPSLKSYTDCNVELPSDEFDRQSRGRKRSKSKPSKSCVTETSSLRRTSPRLRRINYVTQSQNSDISSVVGSSRITNTRINVEQNELALGNNSMSDEEVERLNALIDMKKEPCDPSENAEAVDNPDQRKGHGRMESTHGETSATQVRCSFIHIDGVQCEALTSERYCSYHQRFPQGNLIKTEPGTQHEQAVPTNITLLDSSLSPNVIPRDRDNDRDAIRGEGIGTSNVISNRRRSRSLEGMDNRNADYEYSSTKTVIKRRESEHNESISTRHPMQSGIYFPGKEQLSERMNSQRDPRTDNTDDIGSKASRNVEMMDLSMSTNFLVLPHSKVGASTTIKPTVTSRATSSSWRGNIGAQPWKDTIQSGYWNLPNPNPVVSSSSSASVVGQLRESASPKWSSNATVKIERQFDVPISPASTPPSLSDARRSSVSPVSPSIRKESNVSPSAPSVPSLDLSRLNLPPHVRRALALKYANKKQSEGVSLAASLAPNLSSSRNRFVEAKKSLPSNQEHTETILKPTDTVLCKPPITSNVIRGRLRQQRSISLDSCPTSISSLFPEVPNSCDRIGSVSSYERFPTAMPSTSRSHMFKTSSATNANKNVSVQPMIDLSASNYIPSLQQSGASKERQNYKDHEANTAHRGGRPEVQEFSGSEGGFSLDKDKISHQRTSSLENIPTFMQTRKRSVRAASFDKDAAAARFGSHPPQPSRLVPATGIIKKEGDPLVSGVHSLSSATYEKETSQTKFATVFQAPPRSLIVTPLPSEKNKDRISMACDARVARSLEESEQKDKDGGYISLGSRPRSATPERISTDGVRLRQYGLLDLGSTTTSSIKDDQQPRPAPLQDRHTVFRDAGAGISGPSPGDLIFPGMSHFKSASSHDFVSSKRKIADGTDMEKRSKRTKGADSSTSEKESLAYLPGVDVQELLHLEHEEQKQLKSLQEVQAKAKATRLKLQALSIELEHLNVLEKKISEDISDTKNKRLEILQGALHGGRGKASLQASNISAQNSAEEITSSQKIGENSEKNSNVRNAKDFSDSTKDLDHDYNFGSTRTEDTEEDKIVNNCAASTAGNGVNVVVTTEVESHYPCLESSFSLGKSFQEEPQRVRTTQDEIDRQDTPTADQEEHMETQDVPCDTTSRPHDPQKAAKDSGMRPGSSSDEKEEWVSEHFEKSRKEFFKKIKQQLSTPKKRQQHRKQRKKFSETKVANSLTVSKERLQVVRERMRGWKEQDGTLDASYTQQIQPASEQAVAADNVNEDKDQPHSSTTTYKDTNLTPSKIPVRDVGDSTKETTTNELKKLNTDSRDKSELKVRLKSKINVKKKRKSLHPTKKASSRPDTHVKTTADHPQTGTQKDNTRSSDKRVQHPVTVESLKKKLEPKTKASKSLSTSKARASVFEGHTGAVCALKVSQGKLFTCSADKTTKAFDIQTGECLKEYKGHHHAVNCLEISDNGERLFTGSNDQTVRSYNVKTCVCTHKFTFDGRVMCLHIGFGLLYVGLSSGIVTLVDLTTNTCVERLRCHEPRAVSCLATATEGQRTLLCTGSFDATISIRDHKTGLLFKTLTGHSMTVLCMQVVDNVIYSGAADAKVLAHNLTTGELLRSYSGHTLSVSSLQVVGRVLVTSCLDKLIRCYDLMSAELLQAYGGQSDMIFSVHLSNGRIYSGTRDGKVSSVKLDLRVYHPCKWKDCQLNFGIISHMKDHIKDFHIIQQGAIDKCLWADCAHVFSESDSIETILDHVDSHLKSSKGDTG